MYGLAGPSAPVASMSSKGKESAVAHDQMMKGSAEDNEDDYDMKDDEEYLKGLQNTVSLDLPLPYLLLFRRPVTSRQTCD
jgi:hypothetical protein